jgi:hypothetical protein
MEGSSLLILGYYPGICLKGLRKITKKSRIDGLRAERVPSEAGFSRLTEPLPASQVGLYSTEAVLKPLYRTSILKFMT